MLADNGDQPATKQDLRGLKEELTAAFREAIHETETRLLRAFHAFAERNELRFKRLESAEFTSAERLARLEERIFEIEKNCLRRTHNRSSHLHLTRPVSLL